MLIKVYVGTVKDLKQQLKNEREAMANEKKTIRRNEQR